MTDEGASADWDVSRMSVDAWFWMVAGVRRVKKASIWAAGLSAAVVVGLGCGVIIVTRPSSLLPLASTIAVGAVLVASNASWLVRKIGYTRVVAPLRSLLSETLHYGPDPSDLARLLLSGSALAGSFRLEARSADDGVSVHCSNLDNSEYRRSWYWWSNAAS